MPVADTPTLTSFSDLKLSTSLLLALESAGYDTPTPVQSAVIPNALARHDVMAMAKTGSGKTAAFCLPLLQLLLPYANKSTSPAHHPVQVLILTPTRELSTQIYDNLHTYAQMTDLRSMVIVGGMDMQPQVAELKRGVEIVVATVGRLLDHLRSKTISLESVRFLVLDECDRMLDMGFLPDLTEILRVLPEKRQSLLFSATLTPDIRKLANTYLRNPVELNVSEDIEVSDTVRHEVLFCQEDQKFDYLVKILKHRLLDQSIVFINTKRQTRSIAKALSQIGITAEALHGDMSQFERDTVLSQFRDKTIRVLIATDVAARGLDIPALPLVINLAPPHSSVEYVHRVGRTGRAGLTGEAITLCSSHEKVFLQEIEKLLGLKIPEFPLLAGMETSSTHKPTRTSHSAPRSQTKINSSLSGRPTAKGHSDPKNDLFYKPYQPKTPTTENKEPKKPSSARRALPALLRS